MGTSYLFSVLVCGLGSGPTLLGRVAAGFGRSGQALAPRQLARIEVYVDDPVIALRGTSADRVREFLLDPGVGADPQPPHLLEEA